MRNYLIRFTFLLLLLVVLVFIVLSVNYTVQMHLGILAVPGGYSLAYSNYVPSAPNQEALSGATGVRFTGKRFRIFDLPRLYEGFDPTKIKKKIQKTRKYNCTKWIVFTTVYSPNESVRKSKQIVESQASWCCVVVFDKKTPADEYKKFQSTKFILLTVEDQNNLGKNEPGYNIIDHIPWSHFARKNVGYLYAINQNAEVIYELDDDNLLLPNDIPIAKKQNGYFYVASPDHVYNPYKDFIKTDSSIWPRGFPLDFVKAKNQMKVKSPGTPCRPSLDKDVSIQQFLANHDPDVDAIYTLTNKLPIYFDESSNTPMVVQTVERVEVPVEVHEKEPAQPATLLPSHLSAIHQVQFMKKSSQLSVASH